MKLYQLFIFFLCLYALSIGTALYSSDGQVMYATSRALIFEQTIALPENYNLPQIWQGKDGRWYSQYDPGLPLLAAPLIWLSDALAKWQLWNRYAFSAYALMMLSAAGAALSITLLASLAQQFYDRHTTFIIALSAGLGTPLWVYARQFFAEAILAGLITLAFALAYRKQGLWAGLGLGIAILMRAAMVIYLVPLVWLLIKADPTPSPLPLTREGIYGKFSLLFQFGIFPLVATLGLLYHNLIRSGDPFNFGYGGQAFDTPPWIGIAGLLFSPGKSIFLYAPPLILSVIGWRRFHRRVPALAEAILMAAVIALIFYGSWWAWHGGWCWGARLLVPIMPLWVLPMGEVIKGINHKAQGKMKFRAGQTPLVPRCAKTTPLHRSLVGVGLSEVCETNSLAAKSAHTESDLPGFEWQNLMKLAFSWQGLVLCLLPLSFCISFLGAFTDINAHYARYPNMDVVHYNLAASPLVGALQHGEWIPLAAFHLQDMGWTPASAIIFPAILCLGLIFSLISLLWENKHEQ